MNSSVSFESAPPAVACIPTVLNGYSYLRLGAVRWVDRHSGMMVVEMSRTLDDGTAVTARTFFASLDPGPVYPRLDDRRDARDADVRAEFMLVE